MKEDNLPKVVSKKKKRVGRGYGSGKGGHTAGRGQKGQKSRGSIGILFEGGKTRKSLLKRLPQLRGKAKNKGFSEMAIIKTEELNAFPAGAKVDTVSLVKKGLVDEKRASRGVKVLGGEKVTKKLTVNLPTSASARAIIEKAGGKVVSDA